MFDKKNNYPSDIQLGEKYLDKQTGIEGVATGISFYQFACERVTLELIMGDELHEYTFDAPRLTHVSSGQQARSERPGGPRTMPTRPTGGRR